jgi:hypothetical protein
MVHRDVHRSQSIQRAGTQVPPARLSIVFLESVEGPVNYRVRIALRP